MSFIHKEKPNSLQYHKPHIHQTGQGREQTAFLERKTTATLCALGNMKNKRANNNKPPNQSKHKPIPNWLEEISTATKRTMPW